MTLSPPVCVLGMHRSGTSLLTGILETLGVDLGAEQHRMPPTPNNPRGYFEHQLLTDVNDELLARLGCTWHTPPAVTVERFAQPDLADLRRKARTLLLDEFDDVALWGWKDPRTCLVVPFWELLVPTPRYVLCLRSPADVARSLARSEGIANGLSLWLRYTSDSLVYTRGKPRLLVFYEDLIADWRSELERLAEFVGASVATDVAADAIKAKGFVDRELCHHAEPLADLLDDPRVPLPAKALYVVARLVRACPTDVLGHGSLEALAVAALTDRVAATELLEAVELA